MLNLRLSLCTARALLRTRDWFPLTGFLLCAA